jgi:putative flippase GtrA
MTRTQRLGVRLHDLWAQPHVQRFWRYAIGSVIASIASQVAFLTVYGLELGSPLVATVWAFAVGIPINYVLNRRWAWVRRGKPGMREELLPYALVIGTSIVVSAWATDAVDAWLLTVSLPRLAKVAIVGITFAVVNGGLFLAKYVLLDRLVFRGRSRRPVDDQPQPDVEPVP